MYFAEAGVNEAFLDPEVLKYKTLQSLYIKIFLNFYGMAGIRMGIKSIFILFLSLIMPKEPFFECQIFFGKTLKMLLSVPVKFL